MLGRLKRSCSRLRIFISYAREDENIASDIAQTLRNRYDTVFYDEDSLPTGGDFNARIQAAISEADRFIFLLSPHSSRPDSYAQTELAMVKRKWQVPVGKVWPVSLDPELRLADISSYLRSVNILVADGNLPAHLASEIDASRRWSTKCVAALSTSLALMLGAVGWFAFETYVKTPIENVTVSAPVFAGHFTGASSVIARLNVKNRSNRSIQLRDLKLFITGSDNKRTKLDPEGVLVNQMINPIAEFTIAPDQSQTLDVAFLYSAAELFSLHSRIQQHLMSTNPNVNTWDPNKKLLSDELNEELITAARKAFSWSAGEWNATLKYRFGEITDTVNFQFHLSANDVEVMKSVFSQYSTGMGVFPGWRFAGMAGSTYRAIEIVEAASK